MSQKVIVMGAGFGGLATAALLAKRGFEVHVIEQNSCSGGKAGQLFLYSKENSSYKYRFDTGPSLFSLLPIWKNLYNQLGYNFEELNPLYEVDIGAKYFWSKDNFITTYPNFTDFAAELEIKTKDNRNKLRKFLLDTYNQWQLCSDLFLFSPFSWQLILKKQFWKSLVKIHQVKLFQKMFKSLEDYFSDDRTRQIFARMATYNGSNPYQTSALFNLISQIEYGSQKQYTPKNGIFDLAFQLTRICQELGVKFHYNCKLIDIEYSKNKIKKIQIKNQHNQLQNIEANLFVSNIDYYHTNKIIRKEEFKPPVTRQLSMSALIFYWGIKYNFLQLVSHNLFCSQDYKLEFDQINEGLIPNDPTVYISISSLITKSDAPDGHQNWFVMVNLPAGINLQHEQIQKLKATILAKIEAILGVQNFQSFITAEQILTPDQIELKTGSYLGSLYGLNSNSMLNAFYRPKSKDKNFTNLYYTGGSVHPGGGIPLAIQSGILLNRIIK